ncbi:hypothetical protein [Piscibacillus halophilus]|uniref:hypothetical protein n=1 Tax=Piscibacillus halophilus TaxID=571933 RepID=UPI00158BFE62|nr:hypothetical protein [Piscibacillus halophilus]
MIKKSTFLIMVIGSLLLSGCMDNRNAKEVTQDTFDSILEADTYDITTTIDINLETDLEDPFLDQYLGTINDSEFSIDQKVDHTSNMQEAVFHVNFNLSPMSFALDLPILQDLNEEKLYIETDQMTENFGLFVIPEEYAGKVLAIDLSEAFAEAEAEGVNYEELNETMITIVQDHLHEKPEEDFTKEDDTYYVTFTSDDIADFIGKLAYEFDDTLTDEDIQKDVDEMIEAFKELNLDDVVIDYTVDGDQIETMGVSTNFTVEDAGNYFTVDFAVNTVYNSINEDVEFSIDPEESETVDFLELIELMESYGY